MVSSIEPADSSQLQLHTEQISAKTLSRQRARSVDGVTVRQVVERCKIDGEHAQKHHDQSNDWTHPVPSPAGKRKDKDSEWEHDPAHHGRVEPCLGSTLGNVSLIQSLLVDIRQVAQEATHNNCEKDETDFADAETVIRREHEWNRSQSEVHETPSERNVERKAGDNGFRT